MRAFLLLSSTLALLGCGPDEAYVSEGVGPESAELELASCACKNPTGDPVGGGAGYRKLRSPSAPRTTVVRTRAALESALASATSGDVVYVADEVTIDVTGVSGLTVKPGVTLASGRGREGGPGGRLLAGAGHGTASALLVLQEGARLTGLRVEGPDKSIGPSKDYTPRFNGVRAKGLTRVEIDNNEISGWVYGVVLDTTTGAWVHHNDIHHNQRVELGYGIVLYGDYDDALIEANSFDYNRHAVAGAGYRGQSYEARYNRAGPHANGHVFDMHGEAEKGLNSPYAGNNISIHHNTVLVTSQRAVIIRGRPYGKARIADNCLANADAAAAVWQRFYTGNLTVGHNQYKVSAAQCSLAATSCTAPTADGFRFVDMVCSPARAEAEWIAQRGVTRGCNAAGTRFCPEENVTRGQMAAFLKRALALPASSTNYFTDDESSIFEADINALAASGITRGCNPPANTEFCPDQEVTRGQMAAFLDRGFVLPSTTRDFFSDDSGMFEANINRCAASDVLRGCGGGAFCPGQPLRREEMARALHRALNLP